MTVAEARAAEPVAAASVGSVPRDYNFAADVLQSNLAAGRANKPAYIDARGTHTYGQLAERVLCIDARFAAAKPRPRSPLFEFLQDFFHSESSHSMILAGAA